ncbi:MAG: hypothetical protein RBS34_08290, partial [Desulfofustis sp.]|nr:hypothetical protein [Desulfofustis sp.]
LFLAAGFLTVYGGPGGDRFQTPGRGAGAGWGWESTLSGWGRTVRIPADKRHSRYRLSPVLLLIKKRRGGSNA